MDAVLNLNKPAGLTSHDVVNRVRRILKTKRVGHAGTLDPLATGVLVVCVGHATRIADFLVKTEKEYEAVLILGATTDTEDSSGTFLSDTDASRITQAELVDVLPKFLGKIEQIPPMVSAVHHEGRRLHELAREGVVVERQPRQVEVMGITVSDFHPGLKPAARLQVVCSKGVYIRTLIADIGAALGVGAYMSELIRTRVGRFRLEDSLTLETLADLAADGREREAVIRMAEAVRDLPNAVISADDLQDIRHGRRVKTADRTDVSEEYPVIVIEAEGDVVALASLVCEDGGTYLQPRKVFV